MKAEARIAELERLLDVERRAVAASYNSAAVAVKWEADAKRLGKRVDELEKTLQFYANNLGESRSKDMHTIRMDGGKKAREALGL